MAALAALRMEEIASQALRVDSDQSRLRLDNRRPMTVELADITRRYVGARCQIDACEMTSRELCEASLVSGLLRGDAVRLRQVIDTCDLAKFALVAPADDHREAAVRAAFDIIGSTRANRASEKAVKT